MAGNLDRAMGRKLMESIIFILQSFINRDMIFDPFEMICGFNAVSVQVLHDGI